LPSYGLKIPPVEGLTFYLIKQGVTVSIINITARNVPQAYVEGLWSFRISAKSEDTRNGEAMVLPAPTFLTIQFPEERLLNCPVRNANPFFHCMEFVWMMAGSNDAPWIGQFNKRMESYADSGVLRGAYGWRWSNPSPQIHDTIALLRSSPGTRQAVLSMWDPTYDNSRARTSDRPCNTTIYFRVDETDSLNMTVCNRSNDFVWGMLGANAVHMTLLQELIARAAGFKLGMYHVFSNNCHIYTELPRFNEIYNTTLDVDIYKGEDRCENLMPLLAGCDYETFMAECQEFLLGANTFKSEWLQHVAYPIQQAYLDKKNRWHWINEIMALDWHRVCEDWATRLEDKKRLN
jgi:hypothetical protein